MFKKELYIVICLLTFAACSKSQNAQISQDNSVAAASIPYAGPAITVARVAKGETSVTDPSGKEIAHFGANAKQVLHSKYIAAALYEDNGPRVIAYNGSGQVILNPSFIASNATLYVSDEIVAVAYENEGERFLAASASGAQLINPAFIADNLRVAISNKIIAVSYYDDGERFIAMNSNGAKLETPSFAENKDASMLVSDKVLAITYKYEGQRVFAISANNQVILTGAEIYGNPIVKISDDKITLSHDSGIFSVPLN